jgi:hypothetical protein
MIEWPRRTGGTRTIVRGLPSDAGSSIRPDGGADTSFDASRGDDDERNE